MRREYCNDFSKLFLKDIFLFKKQFRIGFNKKHHKLALIGLKTAKTCSYFTFFDIGEYVFVVYYTLMKNFLWWKRFAMEQVKYAWEKMHLNVVKVIHIHKFYTILQNYSKENFLTDAFTTWLQLLLGRKCYFAYFRENGCQFLHKNEDFDCYENVRENILVPTLVTIDGMNKLNTKFEQLSRC